MARLTRAFVLVDSMHGLKRSDEALLQALRENAISHQVVLSKADRLLFPNIQKLSMDLLQRNASKLEETAKSVKDRVDAISVTGPKALGEILSCSTVASLEKAKYLGINNLRWSILVATGFSQIQRDLLPDRSDARKPLSSEPPPINVKLLSP
ncbi:MAG: hypothetical protein Q9219_004621 [cf. Caloplaca sp. 3 TL-2023]